MDVSRFPRDKYIRQARRMHDELHQWRQLYAELDRAEHDDHRALVYARRAEHLRDLEAVLLQLVNLLYETPRLS